MGLTKDSFFPFTESYRVSGNGLEIVHDKNGSQDTVVGIATGYGLDRRGRSSSPGKVT
jgi:hypothetical protein